MTKLRAETTEKDGVAKRVSFPPDEDIVSGFAECADTQRTGGRLTVADVIAAYEQSCVKHQVEPNQKAVEQMKVCKRGSAGCLDLRGERLDYRSCESLEEILKSMQFESINLEDAELEENGASSLLEMILYYDSTCHLNVSSNMLGTTGWAALSHLIRQSISLVRLDVCSMPVVEYPSQCLAKGLPSSRLRVLHLQRASLSGRPLFTLAADHCHRSVGALIAGPCLALPHRATPYRATPHHAAQHRTADSPKSIQRSPIYLVPTVPDGSVAIPHATPSGLIKSDTLILGDMGTLKKNSVLEELSLSGNDLNSYQDSMQLGELLKNNRSLRTLDLSHNLIADAGLEEICEGLKSEHSGLKILMLLNNQITCAGMEHMANVLPQLKVLESLTLDRNALYNEGIHMLKEPLMRNRSILRLGLAYTHITCEGAVALAEYIAESRQIRQVDARGNAILCGGLMAVSLALRVSNSLVSLEIDHTTMEEQDEFLIETQERLLRSISDLCAENRAREKEREAAMEDKKKTVERGEGAMKDETQTYSLKGTQAASQQQMYSRTGAQPQRRLQTQTQSQTQPEMHPQKQTDP
ncbi:protein phosphatase 1 regulatory subunit 37 [Engraulis encrasicolus]|uniref:protein phosphatase 1 regulatory subunit 37 n=1 Tax=Engraulis encrasicolus TaxID=184585 RepID=UPI002FD6AC68